MRIFSSARKYVQNKVNNLSDAVYGVMPSPIQNVADKIGQPIANAANSLGEWSDSHVPDKVKDAATAVFGVPSAIAGGATALNTLSSNMDKGLINSAVSSFKSGIKQAVQTPVGEVAAPFVAGSPAGAGAGTAAAASAPSIASTLGSIGAAVLPSAIQAGASMAGAIDYNQTMRDTNRETNQTNMAIANQNLAFQRELQNYNKNLQQTIFNREDSSYQRTVKDMRAAGMSPLAMNGTNGAGEAIALGAMNNQYQHTPLSDYKSPLDALASINPIGYLSSLEDLRAKRLQNSLASDTLSYQKARVKAESLLAQYNSSDSKRREKFNNAFGIHNSMSEREKMFCILSKLMGTDILNSDGSPNTKLDYDKVLDRLSNSKSAQIINNIAKDISGSSAAEKVANSRKTDIYGNTPNDTDEKILQKVKRGEKLNAFESFIYYLMQKGIK